DKFRDPSMDIRVIVPFAIAYLLIFILGVIGNILVICLTLSDRKLQTVQVFICHFLFSDNIIILS
ncbi:hypothetical protein WUBG_15593, partial [Wuchereria bancrofti]